MLGLTWEQLVALQRNVDLPNLAPLSLSPAWHDRAACVGRPDIDWFPPRGQSNEPAKAVCSTCPVRVDCLDYALEQGPTLAGVWGGTSGKERRTMRSGRRRPAA